MLTISIVSHGQWSLVSELLNDLSGISIPVAIEVLVTLNIPEEISFRSTDYPWPVSVLENNATKGFGANHNAAFRQSKGEWFCVMNPDLRLSDNPFPVLIELVARGSVGLIAPMVVSPSGAIEDSIRRFPTPFSLVTKLFGCGDGRYAFVADDAAFAAEWVAGMFMLFRAEDFRAVGGFDEGFFLYYEDVDVCARLWRAGRQVLACPAVRVIHDARRASRRSLRYMIWHVQSMARYFWKHWGRLPRVTGL